MQHIQGLELSQVTLFSNVLDDYIAEENTVRFLGAIMDALGLQAPGLQHAMFKDAGPPTLPPNPTAPAPQRAVGSSTGLRAGRDSGAALKVMAYRSSSLTRLLDVERGIKMLGGVQRTIQRVA